MTATITYSINLTDGDSTPAWLALCLTATPGAQDSGRVRYTVTTEQPAALEAALDADDTVIGYEEQGEPVTITDRQIRTLRAEAVAAGDSLQVAICDVALATGIAAIAEIDESVRGDLEVLGIIPEHVGADLAARAECARVIADAAAQGE